jgi:hypothetical protein
MRSNNQKKWVFHFFLTLIIFLPSIEAYEKDLTSKAIVNKKSAYISPQCYTKTKDANNKVHNPCYSCHTDSKIPNYINDKDLQEVYAFSENSYKNPLARNSSPAPLFLR